MFSPVERDLAIFNRLLQRCHMANGAEFKGIAGCAATRVSLHAGPSRVNVYLFLYLFICQGQRAKGVFFE
jgi:hypothetical protein